MAMRCFCPPESFTPRYPTKVFNFSGKRASLKTNYFAFAACKAYRTASSFPSASRTPYSTFYLKLPEKRVGSCDTNPICSLSDAVFMSRMFLPSILSSPEVRSQKRRIKLTIDDFPDPEGPTTAIDSPGMIRKLTPRNTTTFSLVGQEKEASTNSTTGVVEEVKAGVSEPDLMRLGQSIISKMFSQMPMADIVWFIIPERLAKPMVRVMVQSTKLVRSPMVSCPSITSCPPKQRMLKMSPFAKTVMTTNITPQYKFFCLPTMNTFYSSPEQFLLSDVSFAKERTTRILEKTQVARELANARLLEYYF